MTTIDFVRLRFRHDDAFPFMGENGLNVSFHIANKFYRSSTHFSLKHKSTADLAVYSALRKTSHVLLALSKLVDTVEHKEYVARVSVTTRGA